VTEDQRKAFRELLVWAIVISKGATWPQAERIADGHPCWPGEPASEGSVIARAIVALNS
jgi:hypothetical protein